MYQPSEKIRATFSKVPMVGPNFDNLVADFNESVKMSKIDPANKDVAFIGFLLGTMNTISPGSKFNSEFLSQLGAEETINEFVSKNER